jgi:hypothetical protein
MPRSAFRETDLYPPLRDFLVAQGFTVRGEVRSCDVVATRGEEVVIVEMKRQINLQLLIQGARRQRMTDSVYVAVPRPDGSDPRGHQRGVQLLLRRLELGLIHVALDSAVPSAQVIFHPLPYERKKNANARRAVLREVANRSGDYTPGGSTRVPILTAYREQCLRVACGLDLFGPLSPAELRSLGTGSKTLSILSSNFYEWFERVERGVYAVKSDGREALGQYPELTQRMRDDLRKSARKQPNLPFATDGQRSA